MRKKLYTRPVCIVIAEETYRRIEQITDDEEISISSWIRDAIDLKLKHESQDHSEPIST